MKKIFFLLATVCALVACDPVSEDISNGGHITVDELVAMTSVTTDKNASGQNGNQVYCTTSAPVNATWLIGGKTYTSNYAYKKMKIGDHVVHLNALCADGTELEADFMVKVDDITNPLERYYIYGKDPATQAPFKPGAWDAAAMRFSDNEGKFTDINGNVGFLPYLSDEIYWGYKTLVFDISEATDDCVGRIMNGWWSARYDGGSDVKFYNGAWELQLTEDIAKDCARGNGGLGKDLDLMITSGSCQINSVYYEE